MKYGDTPKKMIQNKIESIIIASKLIGDAPNETKQDMSLTSEKRP